ncbi:hypothetical protein Psed_5791 [Pseudonocardia dioxanivorans CB1190]|uniref:Uncharacterized protein n=1 Tax=Pseudonocardia dioxanivorans (strain ATCC 55486 / DSM 44775 / JCM 13855 / CB1190) TaxID=675635 RepID=F4D1D0_PSEUX|nr:hypothetical protein [Pseudonocardia dioxanivorans]AEA27918.1 hypothetical protein Psed_5791 [Pseudonocardia dioxanivorans CB1190]
MSEVYEVVGPLAVIKSSDGKLHYYYSGSQVPDGYPEPELERLAGLGLIAAVDVPTPPADDAPKRPANSASKAAWVAYAVELGMDPDEAAELNRDQLAERFPVEA